MKKHMQSLAKALSEKVEGSPEKKAVAKPVKEESKEEAQGAKCPTCGHCPSAEAEEEDKE
jgi:hypothetical protein